MLWSKELEGHELWMGLLGYSLAFMRPLGIISSTKIKRTNVEWKSIWNTLLFWDISYSLGWPWTPYCLHFSSTGSGFLILWLLQCLFNYCPSLAVVGSVTIATEVLDGALPGLLLVRLLLLVSVQHWLITWPITFDLNLDIFRCFTQVLDCTKALFCLSQAGKATRLLPSLCIQKGEKPMLPVSRDMLRSQGWWVWFVSV